MQCYLQRKLELEEVVIELHNKARYLETRYKEFDAALTIRRTADEISDKIKGNFNG